ncbi:RrF2 family transcriptional regulator, partial [Clostridium paraputrificum]
DITVAEIMYVLEGPIEIAECIDGVSCDNLDCCATRLLWAKIKNSIDDVMKSVTLQDIVNDYERIKTNNESLKLKL